MGARLSSVFESEERYKAMRKIKLSVVGLDGSGKTTIVSHLNPEAFLRKGGRDGVYIMPTVGLRQHRFRRNGVRWELWDMSGKPRYRGLWNDFYQISQALVFVVDASNVLRLGTVKKVFSKMVSHTAVRKLKMPILVFLSKCDHATDENEKPVSIMELEDLLHVDALRNKVHFEMCNGLDGSGIDEGFEWLLRQCKELDRVRQLGHKRETQH